MRWGWKERECGCEMAVTGWGTGHRPEGLPPDADFIFVHDGQATSHVNVLEKEQRLTNCLTDSLLGGWMHVQPDDSERLLGRKSHHIREIGIQGHEHAAVLNSETQDLLRRRLRRGQLPGPRQRRGPPFSVQRHAVERGFRPEKASLVCEDDLIGSETGRVFEASLDVLRPELRIC